MVRDLRKQVIGEWEGRVKGLIEAVPTDENAGAYVMLKKREVNKEAEKSEKIKSDAQDIKNSQAEAKRV